MADRQDEPRKVRKTTDKKRMGRRFPVLPILTSLPRRSAFGPKGYRVVLVGQTVPWSFLVTGARPLYVNFCTRRP
jgi:hypothetical protein